MVIRCSINVTKIDKSKLHVGKKGTYLNLALIENKEGPDQYGNDFMVVQDTTKEERDRGIRGTILGNGKYANGNSSQPSEPDEPPVRDDVPF